MFSVSKLKIFNGNINQDRLKSILDNKFLVNEYMEIESINKGIDYYNKIIQDIDIDKSNPNNSYIMWVFDKVDTLDINKQVQINPSRISLPDIDVDVPVDKREDVINYIKDKYGHDKVAQIITYTTLGGRKALKEVLRAYGSVSFEEMNRITKTIPEKALVSGELEKMKQEEGESSLIKWTLQHKKKELEEWCSIDDEGKLSGPLAKEFGQAIKIEGTKSAASKHAAGIVISEGLMSETCPFVYDTKTKTRICGLEMNDAEAIGLVKLDILGIAMLDKVMGIESILRTGSI